jgi:hypothetical protein
MSNQMTKSERTDLARLIRRREKVAKSAAEQRAAELKVDVERQLSAIYSPDDDALWAKLQADTEVVVEQARKDLQARCRELGIPDRFAPDFHLVWSGRSWETADKERRNELRRLAHARIDATYKTAITKIETSSVEFEAQVLADGLTSEAAKNLLTGMPSVEQLMPRIETDEVRLLANS